MRSRVWSFVLILAFSYFPAVGSEVEPDEGTGWSLTRLDLELRVDPERARLEVTGRVRLRLEADSSSGPALALNAREALFEWTRVEGPVGCVADLNGRDPSNDSARVVRVHCDRARLRGNEIELELAYASRERGSQFLVAPEVAMASWVEGWSPHPLAAPGEGASLSGRVSAPGTTTLDMPAAWRSLSEGRLVHSEQTDGRRLETWDVGSPIARSFVAGPYEVARHSFGEREVGVYLLSAKVTSAADQARALAEAIAAMERRFGPFPFPSYGIAEVPAGLFTWYAASQQGFVAASSSAFDHPGGNLPLFAHEAAHAWWGNLVGSTGPGSILCSESLAQYGAVLAIEALEGPRAATEFLRFSRKGYSPVQCARGYFALQRDGHDKPLSELGSGGWQHSLADAKGHWVYHMLRQQIGDERFFGTLRRLIDEYAGREMSLADLRRAFLAAAPPEARLDRFFTDWLDREGAPVLELDWSASETGNGHAIELHVRQSQPSEPYRLPIEVALTTAEGRTIEHVVLDGRETRLRLASVAPVEAVQLDPDNRILRWHPDYAAEVTDGASASGEPERLVSDFDQGAPKTEFGNGWHVSTDRFLGGESRAEFRVVAGGAADSPGALLVEGTIADRPAPRWGGVMFAPGDGMFQPVDLSSFDTLRFWAKGDGGTYSIMLFTSSRGMDPSIQSFVAGESWTEVRVPLEGFDGADGSNVTGVLFAAGRNPGPFRFAIDEVRFER